MFIVKKGNIKTINKYNKILKYFKQIKWDNVNVLLLTKRFNLAKRF